MADLVIEAATLGLYRHFVDLLCTVSRKNLKVEILQGQADIQLLPAPGENRTKADCTPGTA